MDSREEVLTRLRFLQTTANRSAPPHCHPLSILVLILSAGFVMVGMVMTIVAHWPGSVSVGFDPLSIPGPIILSVSFLIFMLGILMAFCLKRKEDRARQTKFVDYAKSASKIDVSGSVRPGEGRRDVELREMYRGEVPASYDEMTSPLLLKSSTNTDVVNSDSFKNYSPSDYLDNLIPDPVRKQQEKKYIKHVEKKKVSSSESGNDVPKESDADVESGLKTTTTTTRTTTVIKKTRKKQRRIMDEGGEGDYDGNQMEREKGEGGEEDDSSLRVKIKTKPGTSVNISHV